MHLDCLFVEQRAKLAPPQLRPPPPNLWEETLLAVQELGVMLGVVFMIAAILLVMEATERAASAVGKKVRQTMGEFLKLRFDSGAQT